MTVTGVLGVVALAVGAVLCSPRMVLACDCHGGGPVCEAFWKTPVVFVGQVESIQPLRTLGDAGPRLRVRFRVTEALRGTTARQIDIVSGRSSCSHYFTPGEHWVVYAFPEADGGALTTHTCTRTAPLAEAGEDVAYARASRALTRERGRVFGEVTYARKNGDVVAVPGARITLEGGPAPPIPVLTDRRGRYEVFVPAGRYRLQTQLPSGMTTRNAERAIELADGRGCAQADVLADYPGQVAGRVVDALGTPIPNLTVELVSTDSYEFPPYRLRAVTDADGRYAIDGVQPGHYAPGVVMGVTDEGNGPRPSYWFGSGSAASTAPGVDVAGGSRRPAGDLVVPARFRIVQVTGTVVQADGRPAAGCKVRVKAGASDIFPWTTIRTDARGAFSFALVSGLQYRLVAERDDGVGSGAALTVDPSQVSSPLRLTLAGNCR